MTISSALEEKIKRYYYVEKWRIGTISQQLGVHHGTVKRVLSQVGVSKNKLLTQSSMIDPFLPFIIETLEKYPKLTASRLYAMVQDRDYPGGIDHFRHLISLYRPKKIAEAYSRLSTLPAEQSQIDWGCFGHVTIGKAERALSAFVAVLSYSRKPFLRFYLNQRMENFLRGHVAAFERWGGVPRVCLYDNLKSAVLERQGDAIRFNPTLLDFAGHYRFEPRPVAVYRGNEKGRVERTIRYIRENFFAAREFKDIDDLNAQAEKWFDGPASHRPCPEDKAQSVQDVFLQEQPKLIALPDNPFPTEEREIVKIAKTPYARFDLNDYSVPHQHTRCSLTVLATLTHVTILKGDEAIATHERSFDKAQQIEQASHIKELISRKKQARQHRGQNRLTHAVSNGSDFLKKAAEKKYSLASTTKQLLELLDDYGAAELEAAMAEALSRDVPHPNAVRLALQKRLDEKDNPPPLRLTLSKDKRVQELNVKTHKLSSYDQLQQPMEK
ncbi:IS21 family transposase [Patescibacteria group bacterium]|nr:IS21 family transposase [Patescibacteria group bacterium]